MAWTDASYNHHNHHNHLQVRTGCVAPLLCILLLVEPTREAMGARDGADGGTGSARRRRERRLRSSLRHEHQSIAAVLATVTDHSFRKVGTASGVLRNQKTATRTGNGEEYETHFTAKIRKTPLSQLRASQHLCPRLLAGRCLWCLWCLRTWDLSARSCRFWIFLCRRWWTTWRTTWRTPCGFWIARWPSRLPKFLRSLAHHVLLVLLFLSRSQRNILWKCRQDGLLCAEQVVGTPVPLGRGKRRVQGFLPEQSSTAKPSSLERISEQVVEQNVDISPGGDLGQGSASSAGAADEDFTGGFSHFSHGKKCGVPGRW